MRGRQTIASRTADLVEPRTDLSRGPAAHHSTAPGWTGAEGGGVRLRASSIPARAGKTPLPVDPYAYGDFNPRVCGENGHL